MYNVFQRILATYRPYILLQKHDRSLLTPSLWRYPNLLARVSLPVSLRNRYRIKINVKYRRLCHISLYGCYVLNMLEILYEEVNTQTSLQYEISSYTFHQEQELKKFLLKKG